MISQGNTEGVFQFESQGMKNVLMRLKPDSIEDLIAVVSLYRPDLWTVFPVTSTAATIHRTLPISTVIKAYT